MSNFHNFDFDYEAALRDHSSDLNALLSIDSRSINNYFHRAQEIIQKSQGKIVKAYDFDISFANIQKGSCIKIQSLMRGFLYCQECNRTLTSYATKVQACIQGCLSQKQLCENANDLPDAATQQGHLEEMQHLNNLLCSFNSDLNVVTNKF
eukprot:7918494-Ditylum_brightwellii.AAC.1